MINNDDHQLLIDDPNEAQLILKALNTNWTVTIDFKMHEEVLKYIHGDIFFYSPRYVWPELNHLIKYFANGFFVDFDINEFHSQPQPLKALFCMTYISTLYTKWLINDFSKTLREKKDGVTYNLDYKSKNGSIDKRAAADIWRSSFYAMDMMTMHIPGHCPEHMLYLKYSSSTPFLSRVFNHLIQIKQSFSLFLEIFYRIMSQMELSMFDYKTYNSLHDSIVEEKYNLFKDIIYDWNNGIISELAIILERLYPIFLFLETNIQNKEQNILDNIRCFLTESISEKYSIIDSPNIVEASLTSHILITIINFLLFNTLQNYLNPDVKECLHYFWPKNKLTGFHLDYKVWINENMNKQLYFFQNTASINLLDGLIDNDSQILRDDKKDNENKGNNRIIENQANHEQGQQTKQQGTSASSDNEGQPVDIPKQLEDPKPEPIEKPFIKIPCGQRMLEKLIKGLIEGHKDETLGNFTPLVTSKTGEDREAIKKKLICLFTGEGINDESIKWPYDLKWNDKGNSLKLLVYLLHYKGIIIDPLDEKEGAIDKKDVEGINQKIRTVFRGKNVWAIVGTALGYGKNTLRNKIKIPKQSNLSLMKKLAQFWFECKKLDD